MMNSVDYSTRFSTVFGMVLTTFVTLKSNDVLQAMVLGALGGISSFMATLLVKYLLRWIKDTFLK